MAILLPWLSFGTCTVLAVACVLLIVDARGQRRALRAAQEVIASLRRQVMAHDEQIGNLTRAVALLTPHDDGGSAPKPRLKAQDAPIAGAREEHASGWHEIPTSSVERLEKAAIRARAEAEADAREQERDARLDAADRPTTFGLGLDPPTLLSAGVALERMTSLTAEDIDRVRALAADHRVSVEEVLGKAFASGSASVTANDSAVEPSGRALRDDTPTPTEPGASRVDARIERRWHEKIAAAQRAGKNARHCHGPSCRTEQHPVGACGCWCDGCERVLDLLALAQREIRGRE